MPAASGILEYLKRPASSYTEALETFRQIADGCTAIAYGAVGGANWIVADGSVNAPERLITVASIIHSMWAVATRAEDKA